MHVACLMAHPDDAEITCGGSLLAWRAMGARVTVVVATDGARGGEGPPEALARRRAEEAAAGAAVLGAELVLLGLPDGGLADLPALPGRLRPTLLALAPDVLVTHAANDYHADHRALAAAARAAAGFSLPLLQADAMMGTGFVPTQWIDTGAHQARKEAAILCHASQQPDRFAARAALLSRLRSAQCGRDEGHAEAFRFEPVYPFADIRALLPPPPPLSPVRPRGPA